MSPFDEIDNERLCKDEAYFRGSVSAQLTHLHKCVHDLKSKVENLTTWKIQVMAIASAVSVVVGLLFKFVQ